MKVMFASISSQLDQTCADFYYTLIAQVRENSLTIYEQEGATPTPC